MIKFIAKCEIFNKEIPYTLLPSSQQPNALGLAGCTLLKSARKHHSPLVHKAAILPISFYQASLRLRYEYGGLETSLLFPVQAEVDVGCLSRVYGEFLLKNSYSCLP